MKGERVWSSEQIDSEKVRERQREGASVGEGNRERESQQIRQK